MTALALSGLLAALGAFGLGFTVGSRRERASARADIATWRELANELHAQNGKLRCESASVPAFGEPPSGAPNALHRLRTRLEVSADELALRLGIPIADVATLEHTRFGLLDVDAVERHANVLGCRLDIVAVHRLDGIAHWLSDDHLDERLPRAARRFPPGVRVNIVAGPVVDGQRGHNWEATDLAGRFLAAGWSPGSENDAREAAWQALEEVGLASGEGDRP